LKVSKKTVASIILKWKKFETTKTLLGAVHLAKPSNTVRRALVREVTKNLMVTLTEHQSSSVEMGEPSRRTIISAARRMPLLSKRHMTSPLEYAKRNLKDSQTMRNKILWSENQD
jgi:hypothetical protein